MRTYAGRLGAIASFVTAVVSGIPSSAHAGPVEQFAQVLWHDAKPERVALRYTNSGGGLVVSDDGGHSFALICAAALGTSDLRSSAGLMDGDGRIWLTSFDGVTHDDGTVCTWTHESAFAGVWATDIVLHPSRGDVRFAITSAAEPVQNGIFRSEGQGAFAPFGSFDDTRPTRLRIARRGDGLRFYQSVIRGSRRLDVGGNEVLIANYLIRYSDDDAEHWTEHAFSATEGSVRLEAVDPTDAQRIVVSVTISTQTTLYVSSDGGATFTQYLDLAALGGIAFTPEGRVYIGDSGDLTGSRPSRGLWRAESLSEPARLLTNAYPVQCLGYRASDSTLFACDRYQFGVADPETGALSPRVALTKLERLAECPGSDVRAQCRMSLLDGYCGTTHFPCAPVCDAYEVDLSDLYSGAGSDPSLAACFARRNPEWRPPAAMDAGAPSSDAAAALPDAGPSDAAAPQRKQGRSDCHIAQRPGGERPSWQQLLLWAAAATWLVRARRPKRAHPRAGTTRES